MIIEDSTLVASARAIKIDGTFLRSTLVMRRSYLAAIGTATTGCSRALDLGFLNGDTRFEITRSTLYTKQVASCTPVSGMYMLSSGSLDSVQIAFSHSRIHVDSATAAASAITSGIHLAHTGAVSRFNLTFVDSIVTVFERTGQFVRGVIVDSGVSGLTSSTVSFDRSVMDVTGTAATQVYGIFMFYVDGSTDTILRFRNGRANLFGGGGASYVQLLMLDESAATTHTRLTVDVSGSLVRALGVSVAAVIRTHRHNLVRPRYIFDGIDVQLKTTGGGLQGVADFEHGALTDGTVSLRGARFTLRSAMDAGYIFRVLFGTVTRVKVSLAGSVGDLYC
ncbi:MAG: hypothetical protein Q8J97_16820, partial [Flavobacteriaceae bacterium]|nr:hypothetical protein [Flavobacteriaceae bacterium]